MQKWLSFSLLFFPLCCYAYIGPGLGLSAIGSLLAFLFMIIVLIFGFFWYPIKRVLAYRKNKAQQQHSKSPHD